LAWIVLAELLLLLLGWKLGSLAWPVAGAFAIVFALVAYRTPEVAWILVWLATPFSREIVVAGGAAVSVPTEPMMAVAVGVWILRRWPWRDGSAGPRSIALPLGVLAAISLVSIALSRFPLEGLKAWIMAGLYVVFGYLYFVSTPFDARRARLWMALGVLLASLLSIYASYRALSAGIGVRSAYGAARPFFPEHGTFSAYLAFFLPVAVVQSLARERGRLLWTLGSAVILVGIVLSFTRAAWLSIVFVLPLLLVFWTLGRGGASRLWLPLTIVALVSIWIGSSRVADPFLGHARTIVNSGNVSNLERVNRWMAAAEMIRARPLTGVGYGVYPEAYHQYRRKSIVTDQALTTFGVHNELLRILSETGWPGLAACLWFVAAVAVVGFRTFLDRPRTAEGRLALGLILGLTTYAVHSLFNSYLGIDKISTPFWVFLGMTAALASAATWHAAPDEKDVA
jgi:O-antigen ligase